MMKNYHFETRKHELVQFLFMHGIRFQSWYHDRNGMTVWKYALDEFGMRVLEEWQKITARRKTGGQQENE